MSKEAKQKQRAAIISYYVKKRQEEKLRDSNLKTKITKTRHRIFLSFGIKIAVSFIKIKLSIVLGCIKFHILPFSVVFYSCRIDNHPLILY